MRIHLSKTVILQDLKEKVRIAFTLAMSVASNKCSMVVTRSGRIIVVD